MNELRSGMNLALKTLVVPHLRQAGFKGSLPHFRRATSDGIDLLTFQFDLQGGGFVVELARCPSSGYVTHWGKEILPTKVTAWDLPPKMRTRIQPRVGLGTNEWFRFKHGRFDDTVKQVIDALPNAKEWWNTSCGGPPGTGDTRVI